MHIEEILCYGLVCNHMFISSGDAFWIHSNTNSFGSCPWNELRVEYRGEQDHIPSDLEILDDFIQETLFKLTVKNWLLHV